MSSRTIIEIWVRMRNEYDFDLKRISIILTVTKKNKQDTTTLPEIRPIESVSIIMHYTFILNGYRNVQMEISWLNCTLNKFIFQKRIPSQIWQAGRK